MVKKQTQKPAKEPKKTKEPAKTQEIEVRSAPKAPVDLAMNSRGFQPTNMEQAWRFANALASSAIVPTSYQKQPADCLIALDLAMRLDAPWLAIMQHVYTVHGRPAMDSALCTALVNRSGIFVDPLEYEVEGNDAENQKYRVRAYAKRKSTGKILYGPWIDWKLVKAEGWNVDKTNKQTGYVQKSKWNTMAEQMFHYRAATWFQRRYCPELAMGMLTTDEAEEITEPKHVDAIVVEPGIEGLKNHLAKQEQAEQPQEPQTQSEIDEGIEPGPINDEPKEKLQPVGGGAKKSNLF